MRFSWPLRATLILLLSGATLLTANSTGAPDQADSADLAAYAGVYELRPGQTAKVTLENGRLSIRNGDKAPVALLPATPPRFFPENDVTARYTFNRNAAGQVSELVIEADGAKTVLRRLPDKPAAVAVETLSIGIATTPSGSKPKKNNVARIGAYAPLNKSGELIEPDPLQALLIEKLTGERTDAIALTTEGSARDLGCDYVVMSVVSKLRQASVAGRIGGLIGKGGSVDDTTTYEAQVDFKLVSLADGKTVAQSKALSKAKGIPARAAEAAFVEEARLIL
ncbi:MAG: DUF3471 domain-containing protein, partial [Blastocatellia bacterium]